MKRKCGICGEEIDWGELAIWGGFGYAHLDCYQDKYDNDNPNPRRIKIMKESEDGREE